ncbi:MAG: 2-pyrone-4,6-dicarboxylate hydrolase [Hyphomicrobiales bacterium]|nr:MAG: 2-pyrone-4,6-dicarboxylate hydrolase [Hyphomicrobiales bacterium]
MPSTPRLSLPAGACDTHAHVFGPLDRFPTGASTYAIPLADPTTYLSMLDTVGATYGALVQPAPYGDDPAAMENAVAHAAGRVVGIATADADCTAGELERMYGRGVRALRFNERIDPGSGRRFVGAIGVEALRALAPVMRDLGIHAHIWAGIEDCVRFAHEFAPTGVPLVFDHMAQPNVAAGVDDPNLRRLTRHLADGQVWVKLTVCRVGDREQGYHDVHAIHDALVDANPERVLWGSDWPFVRMGDRAPDVADLLNLFTDWIPDTQVRHRILVDNPRELFGLPLAHDPTLKSH